MSLTDDEIEQDYALLSKVASRYGVTASTLAQYVDCAGSYSSITMQDTGVPRKLPPRGSEDGIQLAFTTSQTIGTTNARAVVVRWQKLRKGGTDGGSFGSDSTSGTSGSWWTGPDGTRGSR